MYFQYFTIISPWKRAWRFFEQITQLRCLVPSLVEMKQCFLRWWFLFICLFGVYRPNRGFFSHFETTQLPVKGCKFWPMLGTYGHFLAFHTYCDTAHLFMMVISEDSWHSYLMPSVWPTTPPPRPKMILKFRQGIFAIS